MEEDAMDLRLKLDWARRAVEEKGQLLEALKANLQALVEENGELSRSVATLKEVQDDLLHRKLSAEQQADTALREKADLASENARLHVFARDAAGRAEAAVRQAAELKAQVDARARSEQALMDFAKQDRSAVMAASAAASADGKSEGISATLPTSSPDASRDTGILRSQLAAARLLVARLMMVVERAGINVRPRDLLQPLRGADGSDPRSRSGRGVDPALERELLRAAYAHLGYDLSDPAVSSAATPAATPAPAMVTSTHGSADGIDARHSGELLLGSGSSATSDAAKSSDSGSASSSSSHASAFPAAPADGLSSSVEPSSSAAVDDELSPTLPVRSHASGSMLSPITRPFLALGHGFWSTLVGDDSSATPGKPAADAARSVADATVSDGPSEAPPPAPAPTLPDPVSVLSNGAAAASVVK
jgi:hypothetical protein